LSLLLAPPEALRSVMIQAQLDARRCSCSDVF
jgi:hypothetical protein